MGTMPGDWAAVESLSNGTTAVINSIDGATRTTTTTTTSSKVDIGRNGVVILPAFGVHPWFAHQMEKEPSWLETLESYLCANPRAIVGECGLDKVAVTPETGKCEFQTQLQVFEKQFKLACKLNRPISIHCVRAFNELIDVFNRCAQQAGLTLSRRARKRNKLDENREDTEKRKTADGDGFPPAIMMHSFGGTTDAMKRMINLKGIGRRVYFSFSTGINMRSPKTEGVIENIPSDRLLIETDIDTPIHVEEQLQSICSIVARVRGWTHEQTASIIKENSNRFFSFSLIDS